MRSSTQTAESLMGEHIMRDLFTILAGLEMEDINFQTATKRELAIACLC